jgi:hypothetical protein
MDTDPRQPASPSTAGGTFERLLGLVARWRATAEGEEVRSELLKLGATPLELEGILSTAGLGIGTLIGKPTQIPSPRRYAEIRLSAWRRTYPSAVAGQ